MADTSLWIYFTAALLFFISIDLLAFGRKPHTISIREAAGWSAFWIALSLAFCLWIWIRFGHTAGMEFLSGYLIEKSLSVDNLFIFVLIFHYFSVRAEYQHRVLVWGILGALALRGAMIAAGAAFINSFSWSYFIFGAFLIFAALHILLRKSSSPHDLEANRALRWLSKTLPVARTDADGKFFTRENGRRLVTPIFLALVTIETADLFFAVDSIPAVFGVTRDPFIVFSSNACAILGLRALYFVLAGWIERLRHLATGIAIILLFIGAKMVVGPWLEISSGISLAVIAFVLAVAVVASVLDKRGAANTQAAAANPDPRAKETSLELNAVSVPALIAQLESPNALREAAARELFRRGRDAAEIAIASWRADPEVSFWISNDATVGIAVTPARFAKIRAALGNPPLAAVPPDQDAEEFEWSLREGVHLDILTTRAPSADGAIAKFLAKFGEGIQQVEFLTKDVDHAARLLRSRLAMTPIYPQTRQGANGARVNFFLVGASGHSKVLIELVEEKV